MAASVSIVACDRAAPGVRRAGRARVDLRRFGAGHPPARRVDGTGYGRSRHLRRRRGRRPPQRDVRQWLLAALLLAGRLTAAPPARAPVWLAAMVSMIALLDGTLSALGEGAGVAAWSRVLDLSAAILYTTAALRLTAGLRRPVQDVRETPAMPT
jgi:hypothetical protein